MKHTLVNVVASIHSYTSHIMDTCEHDSTTHRFLDIVLRNECTECMKELDHFSSCDASALDRRVRVLIACMNEVRLCSRYDVRVQDARMFACMISILDSLLGEAPFSSLS